MDSDAFFPLNEGTPTRLRRLIVNADGFGFGGGATQGIMDAIKEGKFISSVSVNANFPEAERVHEITKEFPHISIGVHLNAMVGRPCLLPSEVRSLVDTKGFFHEADFLTRLSRGSIILAELKAEFNAQIAKVKDMVGDRLTHLDSQEHTHLNYFQLFLELARQWGLHRIRSNASLICLEARRPASARLKTYIRKPHVWLAHRYRALQMRRARAEGMRLADHLVTIGYAGNGNKTNLDNWLRILENLPAGTSEIFCHPAYADDTLRRWSTYYEERAQELAILRSGDLRTTACRLGIELISFTNL